jgi:hypothetical protein
LHWLVPEAGLKVEAMQTFDMLAPASRGWQTRAVDSAAAEVGKEDVRVKLRVPPPPDDATIINTPR